MRLPIRHIDSLVGFLTVFALLALGLVVFFLGSKQQWFAQKSYYATNLESAVGVGENMPVLYRGFTVGRVESIELSADDLATVRFYVLEKHKSLVRKGSQIELKANPIDLGNQLLLYSGTGEELAEGSFVPSTDSPEGRQLAAEGLSRLPQKDDSVASLIARGNSALDTFNSLLQKLDAALAGGNDSALGRTVGNLEAASTHASSAAARLDQALLPILEDAQKTLAGVKTLTRAMANPQGSLMASLDARGPVYNNLKKSVASLAVTLANMEKATSTLPAQAPNIARLIADLKVAVKDASDVFEALKNNPLLRGGISDKPNKGSGGTSPRNIRF